MTYPVGTYINLRDMQVVKRTTFSEAATTLFDAGTQILFKKTPEGIKMVRRIPVVYA